MRWSQTFIPTRKEFPADARSKAEGLLLRAGFIQVDPKGRRTWLPLGTRTLRRVEWLIERTLVEMNSLEIESPLDVPELAALMVRQTQSFRDVPPAVHRRQTDSDGRTVIEVITYHVGVDGACMFRPIAERISELLIKLRAQPFPVGDSASQVTWASESADGETAVFVSDKANYSSLVESAETIEPDWTFSGAPDRDLETISTPGAATVGEVANLLGAKSSDVLKTLVFRTITAGPALNSGINPNWVVAVVRGDHEINLRKLEQVAQENFSVGLQPLADTSELRGKFAVGYVGPDVAIRYWDAVLIVDPAAAQDHPWIAGANTNDHHVRNFNWFRECGDKLADPKKTVVAGIRAIKAGDPSPRKDGGRLTEVRARLLMNGDRLHISLPRVTGSAGLAEPIFGKHLRIHLDEIICAVAENLADDHGLRWPTAIAPFDVLITPVRYDGVVKTACDALLDQSTANGIAALLDDRDARAGSKFADADLTGIPIRVTIGERNLADGKLEIKLRHETEPMTVPIKLTAQFILEALEAEQPR